jgi:hypothetical protein
MLRGFATVNYWADDLEAAKGWYAELLGIVPYFERPVGGPPAYVEFRVGDYQHELGLIDSRYAPGAGTTSLGGAVLYARRRQRLSGLCEYLQLCGILFTLTWAVINGASEKRGGSM